MASQSATEPSMIARTGQTVAAAIASPSGRVARFALGAGIAMAGVAAGPPLGYALVAFAMLPIASGALNLCPIAPTWGGSLHGADYCRRPATARANEGDIR